MDAKSEVILRQTAYVKGHVLLINAPIDDLTEALGNSVSACFWTWNYAEYQQHLAQQKQSYFGIEFPQQAYDQIIIFIPKAKELLAYLLHQVASHMAAGTPIFLVGEKKGGIERAAKQMSSYGETLKLDSARHCQLWQTTLSETVAAKPLSAWVKKYTIQVNDQQLNICALPGVFSQSHLDQGTAVLLPYLKQVRSGKLADFGCGAGVISCYLAKLNPANTIYAADVDAFALKSTELTFDLNQLTSQLELLPVTGIDSLPTRLHAIVSNPPFHQGIQTHYAASEALCLQSKAHLKRGGELWIVANRFLNYPVLIEQAFKHCTVKADQSGFKVLYATA